MIKIHIHLSLLISYFFSLKIKIFQTLKILCSSRLGFRFDLNVIYVIDDITKQKLDMSSYNKIVNLSCYTESCILTINYNF